MRKSARAKKHHDPILEVHRGTHQEGMRPASRCWTKGEKVKITVALERPKCFHAYVFNAEQIDGLPAITRKEQTWDAIERRTYPGSLGCSHHARPWRPGFLPAIHRQHHHARAWSPASVPTATTRPLCMSWVTGRATRPVLTATLSNPLALRATPRKNCAPRFRA